LFSNTLPKKEPISVAQQEDRMKNLKVKGQLSRIIKNSAKGNQQFFWIISKQFGVKDNRTR